MNGFESSRGDYEKKESKETLREEVTEAAKEKTKRLDEQVRAPRRRFAVNDLAHNTFQQLEAEKAGDTEASPEKRKLRFRENFKEKLRLVKGERESALLFDYASHSAAGKEIDKQRVTKRMEKIGELMEEFEISNLLEIFDKDRAVVVQFARKLGRIVKRKPKAVLLDMVSLRRETLEIQRIEKLVEDDESFEVIFASIESGNEIDFDTLIEENQELFAEENEKEEELKQQEAEFNEILASTEEAQAGTGATLDEEEQTELSEMLASSNVSSQEFNEVTDFVGDYIDLSSISVDSGELVFNITSVGGVVIPARMRGDTLILEGEVSLKIGDKIGLENEIEVFEVAYQRDSLAGTGDLDFPEPFDAMFESRELAQVVNEISNESGLESGAVREKSEEITLIYQSLAGLEADILEKLKTDILKASSKLALDQIAKRLQDVVSI